MSERDFERFEFRYVREKDVDDAAQVEADCFPPNEACAYKDMVSRVEKAPELFLLAVDKKTGVIAGSLNGVATNEEKFRDEFFTDISLHDPDGANVMLLGLSVMPDYRRQGLAQEIVRRYADEERAKGRKRLVLTCLDDKVGMYLKFGFTDLGESASKWGGEDWHDMEFVL